MVYEDDNYVITDICDNGGGIDMEILPKIFDPYFTTKDETTGTGLGLYMSKMIIDNHFDGNIEAYNQNEGVCFRVSLSK
jgi:signal transduction histidine kinase